MRFESIIQSILENLSRK